jgi:hypothetical protein
MLRAGIVALAMVACGGSGSPATAPNAPAESGSTGASSEPSAGPADEAPAPAPPKRATNLQVLPKDMALADVEAMMKDSFAPGLGVECAFCHVEGDFASDENMHKEIARDMLRMTIGLNTSYFGGKPEVTCFTCHQGVKEPSRAH